MPQNRLAQESSPYLQQHADNPVNWYPWGAEALQRAMSENKPILLSIGYSACHWCHVMAHESFEDEETAKVMNEYFINIKVDREERPDLDKIYQTAHQLLAQRPGGWPLTVFLTPEQVPFFAGTYFPKDKRYNMPTFVELLHNIHRAYIEQADEIAEQNLGLMEALHQTLPQGNDEAQLQAAPLDAARHQLAQVFDPQYGGFGQPPKFPHPTQIELCLRHWQHTAVLGHEDKDALNMALHSLESMARGGIYDQLHGGFFRYSTDEKWLIPHFEKMLYDNGPLLALYTDAWSITGDDLFERIAIETGDWVMQVMQDDMGGYYSTLDADSEGEEGKYYVWQPKEVEETLGSERYALFAQFYGLDGPANFEGHWHLYLQRPLSKVSDDEQLQLAQAREQLLRKREQRSPPGLDDKILTAWNGLMIKGMARAGRLLDRLDFIKSAQAAADFVRQQLFHNGRLLASYKDGEARFMAYLDDYVFMIDGLLELLQARWRNEDMNLAIQLAEALLAHFVDDENGGFYYTADDHESLIHRPKPYSDEAIPAGNGIAAQVLLRLGYILGEPRYLTAAEQTIKSAWDSLQQYPYAHSALLQGLEELLYGLDLIVIRSDHPEAWREVSQKGYQPRRTFVCIAKDTNNLPPALAAKSAAKADCAYVCRGQTCSAPLAGTEELAQALAS